MTATVNPTLRTTVIATLFVLLTFVCLMPSQAHAITPPPQPWGSDADQFTEYLIRVQNFTGTLRLVAPAPTVKPKNKSKKAKRQATFQQNRLVAQQRSAKEKVGTRALEDLEKVFERAIADVETNHERREVSLASSYEATNEWLTVQEEMETYRIEYEYANELAAVEHQYALGQNSMQNQFVDTLDDVSDNYTQASIDSNQDKKGDLTRCTRQNPIPAAPKPSNKKSAQKKNKRIKKKIKNAKVKHKRCVGAANTEYTQELEAASEGRDDGVLFVERTQTAEEANLEYSYANSLRALEHKYGADRTAAWDEQRRLLDQRLELFEFRSARQLEEEQRMIQDAYDYSLRVIEDTYGVDG